MDGECLRVTGEVSQGYSYKRDLYSHCQLQKVLKDTKWTTGSYHEKTLFVVLRLQPSFSCTNKGSVSVYRRRNLPYP